MHATCSLDFKAMSHCHYIHLANIAQMTIVQPAFHITLRETPPPSPPPVWTSRTGLAEIPTGHRLIKGEDRVIHIPLTKSASHAWIIRDCCAVYMQFISGSWLNYVILTRNVHHIIDIKVIHWWYFIWKLLDIRGTDGKPQICVCISQTSHLIA